MAGEDGAKAVYKTDDSKDFYVQNQEVITINNKADLTRIDATEWKLRTNTSSLKTS